MSLRRTVALLAAVTLSSCSGSGAPADRSAPAPAGTPRQAGWSKVDLFGSLRSLHAFESVQPHVYGAGVAAGKPLLVDVTDGVSREVIGAFPDRFQRGLDAVTTDAERLLVTDLSSAGRQDAALWWGSELETSSRLLPKDVQKRPVGWVSPLTDGEGDVRAVGAVQVDGGWDLHAWQGELDWSLLDQGRQLEVVGTPSTETVLTGTTETTAVVAGAVRERGSEQQGPEVWAIGDVQEDSGGRWDRYPMATTPDGLTDVAYWDLGWWVAGHRRLRPVVYDFNEGGGESLPVPDTWLDPDQPTVLMPGIPIVGPMVLATQSTDGPTVWVLKGTVWLRIAAPPGRLMAAERAGTGVYLVIDGDLWFRTLPA